MRKNLAAVAVVAIVSAFVITACGTTVAPTAPVAAPTVTATVTATATPTPTPEATELSPAVQEAVFLAFVHENTVTMTTTATDQMVLGVAQAACGALRRGASADQIVDALITTADSDVLLSDFTVVVGAGVAAFCPEYNGVFGNSGV